jgi:hypothetical protein
MPATSAGMTTVDFSTHENCSRNNFATNVFTSPIGRGHRTISAFTRVFDALWCGGVTVYRERQGAAAFGAQATWRDPLQRLSRSRPKADMEARKIKRSSEQKKLIAGICNVSAAVAPVKSGRRRAGLFLQEAFPKLTILNFSSCPWRRSGTPETILNGAQRKSRRLAGCVRWQRTQ